MIEDFMIRRPADVNVTTSNMSVITRLQKAFEECGEIAIKAPGWCGEAYVIAYKWAPIASATFTLEIREDFQQVLHRGDLMSNRHNPKAGSPMAKLADACAMHSTTTAQVSSSFFNLLYVKPSPYNAGTVELR